MASRDEPAENERFPWNHLIANLSDRLLGDDMASTEVAKLQVHAEDVTQPRK